MTATHTAQPIKISRTIRSLAFFRGLDDAGLADALLKALDAFEDNLTPDQVAELFDRVSAAE